MQLFIDPVKIVFPSLSFLGFCLTAYHAVQPVTHGPIVSEYTRLHWPVAEGFKDKCTVNNLLFITAALCQMKHRNRVKLNVGAEGRTH